MNSADSAGEVRASETTHKKGISHRDLKLANILLTKQGIKEAGKTSGSRCPFAEQELAQPDWRTRLSLTPCDLCFSCSPSRWCTPKTARPMAPRAPIGRTTEAPSSLGATAPWIK